MKPPKGPDDLDDRMKKLDERERYALKQLRKSIGASVLTAEGVGKVLPDAVALSADEDGRLPKSMIETTEKAIGFSVAQDPAVLSDALFPIIGSAIRKAVERVISEALFKMNAGLEKGLSVKRLGWRLESLRSGVPYFEIALRRTLDYRVEHIFLIHKKTGLLLADASQSGPSSLADKDMVASMLTAVRDYIKDSLSLKTGQTVDVLSAGDYSIFVEEGPLALIAMVVRGTADPSVRGLAQDALETVHARLGPQLRGFDGEIEPFEKAAGLLEPCLVSVDRGAKGKKPVYAIALLCLMAATGGFFVVRGALQSARDRAFLAALDSESGIIVVDARRSGGRLRGTIMRSAQAREIAAVAAERGFDMSQTAFDVEPYLSSGEVGAKLPAEGATPSSRQAGDRAPAPTTSATPGKTIQASPNAPLPAPIAAPAIQGAAPAAAGSQARSTGPSSYAPSATSPRASGDARLRDLASRLAERRILFGKNSSQPIRGQEQSIRDIRSIALSIVELASESPSAPRIEAIGHAAGALSDAAGDSISVARARTAAALVSGSDTRLRPYLVARGVGNGEPVAVETDAEGAAQNRSASFTVTFR